MNKKLIDIINKDLKKQGLKPLTQNEIDYYKHFYLGIKAVDKALKSLKVII